MDKLLNSLEQWIGSNSDDVPEHIKNFLKEARTADGSSGSANPQVDAGVHNDPSSDSDSGSISHDSSTSPKDGM